MAKPCAEIVELEKHEKLRQVEQPASRLQHVLVFLKISAELDMYVYIFVIFTTIIMMTIAISNYDDHHCYYYYYLSIYLSIYILWHATAKAPGLWAGSGT